ncbi:MAG: ABC transporter permease [Nitriliruptoraceae bacterium]
MNRTWLVASREFTERIRSKAFLISNAAIIGLLALALGVPMLLGGDDEPIAIGTLGPEAEQVGELAIAQQEAFTLELELQAVASRDDAEEALVAGDLDAVLVDASTVLADGALGRALEALLASAASSVQVDATLAEAGLTPAERRALFAIAPLEVEQVADRAESIDAFDPSIAVVYVAVFVLYGLLAVYGQWVAQGIVEEKQSRVIEVLLASLRPTELLTGKVLGLGALGLVQVLGLAGIATAGLLATEVVEIPPAAWRGFALVIPWYVLGFLVYAALFAAAGSLVSRVEDLQSAVLPVIMLLVGAIIAVQFALVDPSGTVAQVTGVFPLTAPIVQPILLAVGQASWVQVVLAVVFAVASIALLLPVAARIYRNSALRTSGRVGLRQALGTGRG